MAYNCKEQTSLIGKGPPLLRVSAGFKPQIPILSYPLQ